MKVDTSRENSQLNSELRWAIALGILLILLGAIALTQPFLLTQAGTAIPK